ncbi:hypothetical protein ACFY6U_50590 [Streptomyces sp. NPDC013157]|uniref:hypothetical protein n=1 Tax=unclassified Streptomyces TaxID=2593676 RepID=UPI0034455630
MPDLIAGTRPVPTDPRTPLQRATDRLTAARRELTQGSPSRARRQELADLIARLETEIRGLKQP